ncbi:hypothetical protein C8J57DRAFT_1509385 [Mycena rebaudengoi]|nr:hypothetical protein C8J57DRAFT_1509385 [Mycena rebaudengoi]
MPGGEMGHLPPRFYYDSRGNRVPLGVSTLGCVLVGCHREAPGGFAPEPDAPYLRGGGEAGGQARHVTRARRPLLDADCQVGLWVVVPGGFTSESHPTYCRSSPIWMYPTYTAICQTRGRHLDARYILHVVEDW